MYLKIKNAIPTPLRTRMIDFIRNRNYSKILSEIKQLETSENVRVYLIGAPEHGNLGDHAIIEAEKQFLSDLIPKAEIIEIPFNLINYKLDELIELVTDDDLIVITGGGYMGSLWPQNDEFIRTLVSNFMKNQVIVFPQTAYYSHEDANSRELLEDSKKVYNAHPNLTLVARDKKTFDIFEEHYNTYNLLTPDIVLYMDEIEENNERDGILLCFRKDREKSVDSSQILGQIKQFSNNFGIKVTETDTVVDRPVSKSARPRQLSKKFDEFRQSKLVITDRLHGMIFASITGTPCIAFNNKTGKVAGVYKWIVSEDYITLLNDYSELAEKINETMNSTINKDIQYLRNLYAPINDNIKNINQ